MSKEKKYGSPIVRSPGYHDLPAYLGYSDTPPNSPVYGTKNISKEEVSDTDKERQKKFRRLFK